MPRAFWVATDPRRFLRGFVGVSLRSTPPILANPPGVAEPPGPGVLSDAAVTAALASANLEAEVNARVQRAVEDRVENLFKERLLNLLDDRIAGMVDRRCTEALSPERNA